MAKKPMIEVRRKDGKIWSHIRKKWLVELPEERVRQEYLCILANEYGYLPEQIDEEMSMTGRGAGKARADFVVWRTVQDKRDSKNPLLVVECKSDSIAISEKDYAQGEMYARIAHAPFFVTHNSRETRYWRVISDRLPGHIEEIENIPAADASEKEIEELIARLKIFRKSEFADCLHQCHNVIRNYETKDATEAFDEIAKILFIKTWAERDLLRKHRRKNLFTVQTLDEQLGDAPLNELFNQTKQHHNAVSIFKRDEQINLRPETGREIVRLLEKYNLSATSEDIKGIAFERFLSKTFRGKEVGQFFTPRSVVEFMVRMIDPQEGEIICDPASGSGGFLIRFFEIVRGRMQDDIDREYRQFRAAVEKKGISPEEKAALLRDRYDELQESGNWEKKGSRAWKLANTCIYGTDANDRMARVSKMNMIMHGDGHGGIYHCDGFLNINGIFEGRFDIVLANPPFGKKIGPGNTIISPPDAVFSVEQREQYIREYGKRYEESAAKMEAAKGKPIASLFELPKSPKGKINTEILFMERCLDLLKPGGRLGIVLPDGVLNNPSAGYVREFCEDRAFIRAIVSLPPETFVSTGATVKASLLFLQKFTNAERKDYESKRERALCETKDKYAAEMEAEITRLESKIESAKKQKDSTERKAAQKTLLEYHERMRKTIHAESRALLKERVDYPIFLYEAGKVGITATGEEDENELYPNGRIPDGVDKSALELYREFKERPDSFFA